MRLLSDSVVGFFKKKNFLAIAMTGLIILSLPLTVVLLQRQQDTRQRASESTATLSPVADVFVDVDNRTKNFATNTELRVNTGDVEKVTYMRFDLTSLAGKTITNARLRLKVVEDSDSTQNIRGVSNDSWTETGITYDNKPAVGSVVATSNGGNIGDWKEIVITSAVQTELQTSNKLLSLAIDQTGSDGIRYKSKEASSDHPQLIVTYSTVTAPTATKTPTGTIVPTDATISPTPALTATSVPPIGGSCPAVATDTVLIIDRSSSMKEELSQAKTAAKLFVDQISTNTNNRVSLVIYDKNATVRQVLTSNFAAVKTAIDSITLGGGTCIQCGVKLANQEIVNNGRTGIKKAAILLSDGRANHVDGSGRDKTVAEAAALAEAKAGNTASGTVYFAIGLGDNVNASLMNNIATETGGKSYFSPTANDLSAIYQEIAKIVGKGSITGTVFHDQNGDGQQNTSEPVLSGIQIALKTQSGVTVQTQTTPNEGTYTFTGLCDGTTYIVDSLPQTPWFQTLPANNGVYTVPITNGSAIEEKNFGLTQQPTSTSAPTPIPLPTVDLQAIPNPATAGSNTQVTVSWTTTNAVACTASGMYAGWTGQKTPVSAGNQIIGPFVEDGEYTLILTCTNSAGSASDSVELIINPPSVTSTPTPTAQPTNSPTPTVTSGPTGTPIPTSTPILTSTPAPGTTLAFTVFLHSIGNSGDNRNPTAHDFSNKQPIHPQRTALVEIFNAANQPVATAQATMTYNTTNGNFTGIASLGDQITTGSHIITVKTDSFLRNLFPGIQTLTNGQNNTVPAATLVAGDTNGDNKLDILDYNTIVGCYTSESQPLPKSCDATRQLLTDLNDNGAVDRHDYNLFLRELSVQGGF